MPTDKKRMISKDIVLGLLFLFQTGFGALGNSFLLGLYTFTFICGHKLRPIDLLLSHLAFVNDVVLLSKGIPQTMSTLGLSNFLDDVGCKLVFYCHKVARDLSLCTTCLLSSYQAITLNPRSSGCAKLKARARKCIFPFLLLCWTFNLLSNSMILLYVKGPKGNKNITERQDFFYCSATFPVLHNKAMNILTVSFPDALYIGIMIVTSGYMVFVLYRHHQRAQYIHGNRISSSSSPETRATQNILLLVITFVSFYSLNTILIFCIRYGISSWIVPISTFMAACFPTFSSLILIVRDSQVGKCFLAVWVKMVKQV